MTESEHLDNAKSMMCLRVLGLSLSVGYHYSGQPASGFLRLKGT